MVRSYFPASLHPTPKIPCGKALHSEWGAPSAVERDVDDHYGLHSCPRTLFLHLWIYKAKAWWKWQQTYPFRSFLKRWFLDCTACQRLCNRWSPCFCGPRRSDDSLGRGQAAHAAGSLLQSHDGSALDHPLRRLPSAVFLLLHDDFNERSERGGAGGDERLDEEHFEPFRQAGRRSALSQTQNFSAFLVSGLVAGSLSGFVTCPLDVIKTRIQTQTTGVDGVLRRYTGFWQTLKLLVKEEGVRSLFMGVSTRIMQQAPAAALSWTVYETVKRLLVWSVC